MLVFNIVMAVYVIAVILLIVCYVVWCNKEERKFWDRYYHTMYGGYDDDWF